MSDLDKFTIRPAGRHILTIGRDLIQDNYAAIVELVKNAYDADSPDVQITLKGKPDRRGYSICIEDHGHGMSRDTIINSWMVPSTDDKQKRKISPGGRVMQGRKGIGRYAASILGDDLALETITPTGETTTLVVYWKDFETQTYLSDVEILIETKNTNQPQGTRLTINGIYEGLSDSSEWNIDKLKFELRKLISPFEFNDKFLIKLIVDSFLPNQTEILEDNLEPYPLLDLFDYRIAGQINENGTGKLTFFNQKEKNIPEEEIIITDKRYEISPGNFIEGTNCGPLVFDIRVYDRDQASIEMLIKRGLKNESGQYLGKLQARQLLNSYNGIGVYRNGFRIRPLGDPEYDWLLLNKDRVQNPGMRIGSDQAIGAVLIQSEEKSGLTEKSARDGLKSDTAFIGLRAVTKRVIRELETRRFAYRKKAGLGRKNIKINEELERLFSYDKLKTDVQKLLAHNQIDSQTINAIVSIITKEEKEKNKIAEDLKQAVAVYQGQATLGKIVNVVLHEGRHPLGFFKNQIKNIRELYETYLQTNKQELVERIILIGQKFEPQIKRLLELFERITPLAAGNRPPKESFLLKPALEDIVAVFSKQIDENGISVELICPNTFRFSGWEQDIYIIFINLIDNSIYWLIYKNSPTRKISIVVGVEGEALDFIDYRDTGPGIESKSIADERIFDPEYSTKPKGTGLGLAIAGEAASRNRLELIAIESTTGAYFRLQPILEEKE